MNQRPTPFDGLRIDRLPEFGEERPRPFGHTDDEAGVEAFRHTDDGAGVEGWTFSQFLSRLETNQYEYEEKRWLKLDGNEIIGFESEGREMFLGIAKIVISFHERQMFSGNLVRRISILPDLNVTHKSRPQTDVQAFEHGGQKSDIDHFRWMVAALVKSIISLYPHNHKISISSKFLLFFSKIFTDQEGLKSYYVSQFYHPIFFNSLDKCNLIRMMRDQYNRNPYIFKEHFELESYGFEDWWLKIGNGRYRDAFHGVLNYNSNFKSLYNKSNGFALPLYIRNLHEHFFQGQFHHENIDSEIDNLFPGVYAAIIDSVIRNLHGYWGLFGSNTLTLSYLQRNSPYGWCFPEYRFHN